MQVGPGGRHDDEDGPVPEVHAVRDPAQIGQRADREPPGERMIGEASLRRRRPRRHRGRRRGTRRGMRRSTIPRPCDTSRRRPPPTPRRSRPESAGRSPSGWGPTTGTGRPRRSRPGGPGPGCRSRSTPGCPTLAPTGVRADMRRAEARAPMPAITPTVIICARRRALRWARLSQVPVPVPVLRGDGRRRVLIGGDRGPPSRRRPTGRAARPGRTAPRWPGSRCAGAVRDWTPSAK